MDRLAAFRTRRPRPLPGHILSIKAHVGGRFVDDVVSGSVSYLGGKVMFVHNVNRIDGGFSFDRLLQAIKVMLLKDATGMICIPQFSWYCQKEFPWPEIITPLSDTTDVVTMLSDTEYHREHVAEVFFQDVIVEYDQQKQRIYSIPQFLVGRTHGFDYTLYVYFSLYHEEYEREESVARRIARDEALSLCWYISEDPTPSRQAFHNFDIRGLPSLRYRRIG